ncbi:MAG: type II toxin-antitoxin system YafQ family toxin [Bacilli bacterium]|nr:type II toxin-antitoxin system YafQ family toxin [Bacilli bacterium]
MRYKVDFTINFKKQHKKIKKQGKNLKKLYEIINKLANDEILEQKYRDHDLIDDKKFKDCRECHIEPDWLLIYKKQENELVLLLFATGSHSELFNK